MVYKMENFKNLINFTFDFSLKNKYEFSISNNKNLNVYSEYTDEELYEYYTKADKKDRQKEPINQMEKLNVIGAKVELDGSYSFNYRQDKHTLGFILLEFLNHYKQINYCLDLCTEKLNTILDNVVVNSEEAYDYLESTQCILDDLCIDIKTIKGMRNCSVILQHEISSFIIQFNTQINKYQRALQNVIVSNQQKLKLDNSLDYLILSINAYQKQFEELNTMKFYKYHYLCFVKQFRSYLEELYYTCMNAFIPISKVTYTDKSTKLYNGKRLLLPKVNFYFKINYKKNSSIKIEKYQYEISSMQELINISLYHIILSKKALLKCEYCGDYFLPRKRNDEKYCTKYIKQDNDGNSLSCGDIGKYQKYRTSKSNTLKLYDLLENRIKKKIDRKEQNEDDFKDLLIELQNKCNEIFGIGNKKDKNNRRIKEFHTFLVSFDKKYQKKFPSKRPYTTKKYWKYTN